MTLQRRLVAAVMAVTVLTLGLGLASIAFAVNRAQERQLDQALVNEAREEAHECARDGGDALMISARPGPAANDIGPLTKYAALFDAEGRVLDETLTWVGHRPRLGSLAAPRGQPFDLGLPHENLRAVTVPVPSHPGVVLLLAAPRTDLDLDEAYMRRAMAMVFAVASAWTFMVAMWFSHRLTRDHARIMEVAHRAAGGDLSARVAATHSDADAAQFGRDLDETLDRLEASVNAQRRFIANAAHELRTPLTALVGGISLTLRRERDAATYREALAEALDASETLSALTDDLLALARMGSQAPLTPEPVAFAPLVDLALADVRAEAQARRCEIVYEAPSGDDAQVLGAPQDLRRALRNLLENALRHGPEGAAVGVQLRADPQALTFDVDDAGEGVAPDERARIFEPFFRGARSRASDHPGSGLGLSITREIVWRHRGTLRCTASPTLGGARFTLTLPRVAAPPAPGSGLTPAPTPREDG